MTKQLSYTFSTQDARIFQEALQAHENKEYEKVEGLYLNLLERQSDNFFIILSLARVFLAQEKTDEALVYANHAIKLNPSSYEAYDLLGAIFITRKEYEKSGICFNKAIDLNPSYALAWYNSAIALNALGKTKKAIAALEKAIELDASNHGFYILITYLYNKIDSVETYNQALNYAKKGFELFPDNIDIILNLAGILAKKFSSRDAIELYDKVLSLDPDNKFALSSKVNTLWDMNDAKATLDILLKLNKEEQEKLENLNRIAFSYQAIGETQKAKETFKQALSMYPDCPNLYAGYTETKRFVPDDEESLKLITKMQKLIEQEGIASDKKNSLKFSLGKAHDDMKNYAKAFAYYEEANNERYKLLEEKLNCTFAIEQNVGEKVKWQIDNFNKDFFDRLKNIKAGIENDSLIFIVGLPRSGTSLVEQIIASHNKVKGGGELPYIKRLQERNISERQDKGYLLTISKEEINKQAKDYVTFLDKELGYFAYLTDKMPSNIEHLAFISAMFPRAKIIFCQRYPLDVFISIYFRNFIEGNYFCFAKKAIVSCIKDYTELNKHWNNVLPNPMLNVCYEELINKQEEVSRRIIDFLELPWDDACLKPQKNKSLATKTSSSWQVRQPIYKTSHGRWKNYQEYIQEEISALTEQTKQYEELLHERLS